MSLIVTPLRGADALPWLDELAALRIKVFREFPYLYDGSADYERDYLSKYTASGDSVIVLAQDGERIVGCSTGLPLLDADAAFQEPFLKAGFALPRIFYFGESVLDTAWRGHGIGHRFFNEREAHARRLDFEFTTFCAVLRPADHPRRPAGYRSLDAFWVKRGYQPRLDLVTQFAWKDIDCREETSKPMGFWVRQWQHHVDQSEPTTPS